MPRTPFRTLARLLSLLAVLLLALAVPGHAQAQCPPSCDTGEDPEDGWPEVMGITPGSQGVSQPSLTVAVAGSDDYGFRQSTFRVYRVDAAGDTTDVTSSFAYAAREDPAGPVPHHFRAVAMIAVPASGSVTLLARICDTSATTQHCPDASATYVRALPGVEVTPLAFSEPTSAGPHGLPFWVRNTGTASTSFQLAAHCGDMQTGGVVACTAPAATAVLAPGAQQAVNVTFTVAAGQDVSATLTATQAGAPGVQDAGWAQLLGYGAAGSVQAAPTVLTATLQSGGANDRGDCVTVATAARGAYECGDLRVAHALPAHRSRGRTWAPVLLYNTQHAHPRPTVYADLTLPAGSAVPDSMAVAVVVGGVTHRASFAGAQFRPGTPRRVGVQWDALSAATGTYAYTLQATAVYGTTRVSAPPAAGEVTLVNRAASPYGAGWWVAGLEQVTNVPGATPGAPQRKLWISGDGSTQLFVERTAGRIWESVNPGGAPDTLRFENATGIYHRRLKGGGEIQLNSLGQHVRTVNRLGQATVFVHAAENRLVGIWAPTTGNGVDFSWMMTYNAGGRLVDVTAHTHTAPPRPVVLTSVGGRVTAIRDPDGDSVAFTYDTSRPNRINGQTDRRGTRTTYTYDTRGKLSRARLWMGTTANDALDVVTDFLPAESRGVVLAGTAGTAGVSVARGEVLTRLNGPRTDVTDVTDLYLDRHGRVRRAVNPAGQTTTVSRGSTAFPALVTATAGPTGQQLATYDGRGRVASTTSVNPYGTGWNAVATYTYDDRWDRPDTVRVFADSGAVRTQLTGTSYTAYDTLNGNPLWQRVGESDDARVTFHYYTSGAHAGQLRAVEGAKDAQNRRARDSLAYDGVGNLKLAVSPAGFRTLHYRDGLGRDTLVVTPVDSAAATDSAALYAHGARQRMMYDVMDRDTLRESIGPMMAHDPRGVGRLDPADSPAERLSVHTRYDDEGAVLQVSRWATPDAAGLDVLTTLFEYDGAGRKTLENDGTQVQRYGYDQGGNAVWWSTGRGDTIRTRYDAMGRVVTRTVPEVSYPRVCYPSSDCTAPFPRYPNAAGQALLIPEEWTHFRYDGTGNMVRAENGDAVVEREYYPNGALKKDVLSLRSYHGTDFGQHVYAVEYGYDVLGRPAWVRHPQNLAGSNAVDRYGYHPVTGALETATDRFNNGFTFGYDHTGQRTSLSGPNFIDVTEYDVEGRRTRRLETAAGLPLHDERFRYDARGKVLSVTNGGSEYYQWYSGLGMLAGTDWENLDNAGFQAEEFGTDALGNVYWSRGGDLANRSWLPSHSTTYHPGRGQVFEVLKQEPENPQSSLFYPETTRRWYDDSGNAERGETEVYGQLDASTYGVVRHSRSRSFYSADQRLRYYQENVVNGGTSVTRAGVWEEYRYDPLGRRVLVRSNRDDLCSGGGSGACVSHVTRYVWSGDQVLWELRLDAKDRFDLDAVSTTGPYHGRVSYFHAGGIDRPLVIRKEGSPTIIPHENWRGQFARGTYTSGTVSDCTGQTTECTQVNWPGYRTTARHARSGSGPDIRTWFGGLVDGMRDQSGKIYMRNRYYDPETGQFTQTDPIGLAGGLNAYGFAAGDPVTYNDPYGLCAFGIGRDAALGLCTASDDFHSAGLNEDKWSPLSSCRMLGCQLRNARPMERDYVLQRLTTLRTDLDFCRKVTEAGLGTAARQLGMWDNNVRDWDGVPLWGNSPFHGRLGGVVMYLSSRLYREEDGLAVVHEAIHGVINPNRRIQPTYYADKATTELGLSIDQSALVCMGKTRYP
jgi:RHS repeat-associated protein